MVDAGGGEQKRFPVGAEPRSETGKDRFAQRFGGGRAAGLPGAHDPEADSPQLALKAPRLR